MDLRKYMGVVYASLDDQHVKSPVDTMGLTELAREALLPPGL